MRVFESVQSLQNRHPKTLLTTRACARAVRRSAGRGLPGEARPSADYRKVEDDYHALKLGAMLYELEES